MQRWLLIAALGCGCSNNGAADKNGPLDPLDPQSFQQFSATVTVEANGQKNVYEYFRDGSKLRIVPQLPQIPASAVAGAAAAATGANPGVDRRVAIIIDQEAKTSTAISYGRKQYFVQPLSERAAPAMSWLSSPGQKPNIVSREPMADEKDTTIDGHACSVERVTMAAKEGGKDGARVQMKVWSAPDLRGFPLRVESQLPAGAVTTSFANVKLAALGDPSLFSIPAGFTNAAAATAVR